MRDPTTGRILNGGDVVYIPYRQHSLYFGFITCVFALVGVASMFRRRQRDVFFWTGAFVICLLCALGGFTPFYRLVYALPMGDYIRCPVKFVHLLEFCAAALAGFGIQRILDFAKEKGLSRPATYALAALALVNVVDLVRVDRRFLAIEDVTFIRAQNAAADAMRSAGGGKVFLAIDKAEGRDFIASSFGAHLADVAPAESAADARFVFATQRGLQANPAQGELLRSGKLKMIGSFAWQKGKGIYSAPHNEAAAALFQVDGVEPPKEETPPESNRTAQFFTWLSIIGTFGVLGLALWPNMVRCFGSNIVRPSNQGDVEG